MATEKYPHLTVDEYQQWTRETAIYPVMENVKYPLMGLAGEIGEVLNKAKKVVRGGPNDPKSYAEIKDDLADELGDAFYYFARVADDLGMDLSYIMARNKAKLVSRKLADTLSGSGDKR